MPSIADLFVSVSSDVGGAISGLTDVDNKVKSTATAMDNAVPAAIALGVAAGAVGAGFATSIGVASDFEHEINGIKAVMSPTEVQTYGAAIEDLALKLGKDTVFSASQAAQGIEELIKAGVPLPAILGGAATAALDLAAATGVSVTQAATLASTAMNTYHQSAAQLPAIMDTIANVSNATAIDVGQLQQALQAVGPVASGVGLSFQDTATALGIFANNGLIGSDAGTSLKTMLLNLEPSTKAQITAFKDLGLITADGANRFFDATGAARPMNEIFQILRESTANLTSEQRINLLQTAFGTDAVRAATIAATEGAAGWDAVTASMDKMGGTQVAAAQRMSGLQGALSQLSGSFEAVQITIGNFFLPVLTRLVGLLTSALNAFLELDPAVQFTITAIVGITAAVAGLASAWVLLSPLVETTIGSFASLLPTLAPLLGILSALGLAAGALYQAWQTDFGGIRELAATVGQAVQLFLGSFGEGLSLLTGAMAALHSGDFTGFLEQIRSAVSSFASTLGPALSTLIPVVLGALGELAVATAQWLATTGLPQLGVWAQAFLDWIGPVLPPLLARLGELANAVFQWIATVGVPNLLVWARAFIDWVAPIIPQVISALGQTAAAIIGWITTVVFPQLAAWASAFIDWVGPMIPPLLAELGRILVAIGTWIVGTALPAILGWLTQWGGAFLAWVGPMIPGLLTALGSLLVVVGGWIVGTALPAILNWLTQWGTAFLSWIAPFIPPLLGQLAQLLIVLAQWVTGTALPLLTSYLISWGTAFLGWVIPAIPPLLLELAQLLATVAGWIIGTALPLIAAQVYQWGTAFIGWAGATIPPLLLELAQILAGMAQWITGTALPMIAGYVMQWGTVFLSWVAPIIPPLLLELANLLAAVGNWIINTALPIILSQVYQWGPVFIQWIGATIPPMLLELGNLLLAMATWVINVALPELIRLTLQWAPAFLHWITDSVIPQLGPALLGLLRFIGDQLAQLPAIIIDVLGDPWAPFVNSTFELGARVGGAIGDLATVISQNIGPIIDTTRDLVTTVVNVSLSLAEPVRNGILVIAGLAAAFVALWPVITAGVGIFQVIGAFIALVNAPLIALAAAAAILYAAWQDDFGGIREVTQQVWEAIQPAFANIVAFIGTIRDTLAPMFASAQEAAGAFTEQLSQALAPILAQLPDAVRRLGDEFNRLGEFFAIVADSVRFLVNGDFDALTRLLGNTDVPEGFITILRTLHDAFDAIGPVVEMVAQAINFLITGNLDRLYELMQEGLPPEFAAALQFVHDVLATGIQVLRDMLGGFIEFVGYLRSGDLQGAWNSILGTIGRLQNDIAPLWNEFLSVMGTLVGALPQFIADHIGDLWAALVGEFNALPGQLGPAWDAFAAWFGGVLGGIPQFIADNIGDMWNALVGAFGGLAGALGPLWDAFAGWFGGVLGGIPQFVGDNMGNVFNALGTAFNDLVTNLSPLWDAFAGWLQGVLEGIPQFVADHAGDFFKFITDAFGNLVGVLQPLWDTFADWLGAVVGGIPQFVIDHAGDIFGGIVQQATDFVGHMQDALQPLADWLGATFGNFWAWLTSGGTVAAPPPTDPTEGGTGTITSDTQVLRDILVSIAQTNVIEGREELLLQAILAALQAGGGAVIGGASTTLDAVAQAVLDSARRVSPPTTGSNPVLG